MSRTVIVRRMSSGQAHNGQVRALVVEDHVALANRIGEGLRDADFAVDPAVASTRRSGANVSGHGTSSAGQRAQPQHGVPWQFG